MNSQLIRNIISYTILLPVFLTGAPARIDFDVYWYYPIYIAFALCSTLIYHKLSSRLLFVLTCIAAYSFLTFNYGLSLVIKQLINIIFSIIVFYNFLVFEKFDYVEIFRKYVNVAKVVLLFGFVQLSFFYLGKGEVFVKIFPWLSQANITVRLQSFAQEPSFVALTFSPVVFLSLHNLFYRKRYLLSRTWSILFIIGYLLTFSFLALISFLISLVLLYFKRFTYTKLYLAIFAVAGLFVVTLISYSYIPDIKIRLDDTFYGIRNGIVENDVYRNLNLSTYATLSNVYVAERSLLENPLTGNGLGTHELSYRKYLPRKLQAYYVLNAEDASSLALRLTTESGLIGLSAFLFFTMHYRIKFRSYFTDWQELFWIINLSIFVLIVLCLLRNGNYTLHGKILFFLLYYYTYRDVRNAARPTSDFNIHPRQDV
jgi:hypothetical protein